MRPRLIKCFKQGLERKLTLISAPAGFGKTTLLSECAYKCGRPVVWISLDEGDNEKTRFLSYFISALRGVSGDFGDSVREMLHASQPAGTEILLSGLINEIVEIHQPFVIVLDDYHVITNPEIDEILTFMVENQPVEMHLVVSSRADPPWPLARWRARREMIEMRTQDLRFGPEEAADLLNGVMKLGLSDDDVERLEARTEGWIAGLLMAAISLQGRQDPSGFIRAFEGSHRYIFDYLVEEVFKQLSPDIQDFLLKTSILDRMCASLCNCILEKKNSQHILAQLEQMNLFVVALDDQRGWYRYHHLFSDLLRIRMYQLHPDIVDSLHEMASQWYEKNGILDEAMRHAMEIENDGMAAELIERHSLMLAYHGDLNTAESWLDRLPYEMVKTRPWLCLARAWVAGFGGNQESNSEWLQAAERALTTLPADERLSGHLAAAHAYNALNRDEVQLAIHLAHQALNMLPAKDQMMLSLATMLLAMALRMKGELGEATKAFNEAVAMSKKAGDIYLTVDVLWERSLLEFIQGNLAKVMASCQEALVLTADFAQQSGRQLFITGYIYERMSAVHLERYDLEAARQYAQESVTFARQWGQKDALLWAEFSLTRVLIASGEEARALENIRRIEEIAREMGGWYLLSMKVLEAQIRLQYGEKISSVEWVHESGLQFEEKPSHHNIEPYFIYVKTLISENRCDEAKYILARILEVTKVGQNTYYEMRVYIFQALLYQTKGELQKALHVLEDALMLAKPDGYVYPFIRAGFEMKKLLMKTVATGNEREYAQKLMSVMRSNVPGEITSIKIDQSILVDSLTEREQEVLRLLSTDITIPNIADELVITTGTLRTHIKRIYNKLDAHSRFEAVTRAQDLGLL